MTQKRQPAGIPTGGQFAQQERAEPDVNLDQQLVDSMILSTDDLPAMTEAEFERAKTLKPQVLDLAADESLQLPQGWTLTHDKLPWSHDGNPHGQYRLQRDTGDTTGFAVITFADTDERNQAATTVADWASRLEPEPAGLWDGVEVIHAYSRADALADGALVDHSELAAEAGFQFPVAFTAAVQSRCVAWPADNPDQDETGRAWDVLSMARFAARRRPGPGEGENTRLFSVMAIRRGGSRPELVDLKMHIGPGDTPEPVLTIMMPEED